MAVPNPPRFQESGVELYRLAGSASEDGFLVDKKGRVVAIWAGFTYHYTKGPKPWHAGLPIEVALATLDGVRGGSPAHASLGLTLRPITPVEAAARGVSRQRLRALSDARDQPMVLEVRRTMPGSGAADQLQRGDLLVTMNGEPLVWALDLEAAASLGPVELVAVRNKEEQVVTVEATRIESATPTKVVEWAGMALHETGREVARWHGEQPEGLYISAFESGGPNHRAAVFSSIILVQVDGQAVGSVDALLAATEGLSEGQSVPVTLWHPVQRRIAATALRMDFAHFPTRVFELAEDGSWTVTEPR
jgi:S1-C subfamily serine protease